MKLKAVLENLDGVDEALQAAYTEKDGKFYLNIESFDSHHEVQNLKKSLTTARNEKKAVETELGALKDKYAGLPEDFTVDEYNTLKDSGGGDISQKLADQRKRLEDGFKVKEEKLTKERDEASGKLNKLLVDNALNAAITDAGVAAPFAPAVRAMFKDKVKVEFEGDEAIVTLENIPVIEHLKTWAGTEMGKHYVAAPGNGGGGAQPGAGGGNKADNPWSKEGYNLTKQAELMKSDPQKAAQLKAAAGVK